MPLLRCLPRLTAQVFLGPPGSIALDRECGHQRGCIDRIFWRNRLFLTSGLLGSLVRGVPEAIPVTVIGSPLVELLRGSASEFFEIMGVGYHDALSIQDRMPMIGQGSRKTNPKRAADASKKRSTKTALESAVPIRSLAVVLESVVTKSASTVSNGGIDATR
ncbi:hypothetical protein G4B88_002346 (mitochondrion) [Cannabis sativa]|uniref:Uncharacterized protein n=1 Tax=Cannabis sativa TaxID=3483 RepID=A0A7J6DV05_CANSA|nr:hypothetical protein G4B88_002346 [Cannabis sativa]